MTTLTQSTIVKDLVTTGYLVLHVYRLKAML